MKTSGATMVAEEYVTSEKVPAREPSKRSLLLLPTTVCLLLVCLTCYAGSQGNPALVFHPSNSAGQICGVGDLAGKQNLLYFDLSACAGISPAVGSCPSTMLCVRDCPSTYWSHTQGMSAGLEQFCDDQHDAKFLKI